MPITPAAIILSLSDQKRILSDSENSMTLALCSKSVQLRLCIKAISFLFPLMVAALCIVTHIQQGLFLGLRWFICY